MKGFGDDHPEATHYSVTGHNPNPSMKFPFWGSILAKEMGATNKLPPYVLVPTFDNRPALPGLLSGRIPGAGIRAPERPGPVQGRL